MFVLRQINVFFVSLDILSSAFKHGFCVHSKYVELLFFKIFFLIGLGPGQPCPSLWAWPASQLASCRHVGGLCFRSASNAILAGVNIWEITSEEMSVAVYFASDNLMFFILGVGTEQKYEFENMFRQYNKK